MGRQKVNLDPNQVIEQCSAIDVARVGGGHQTPRLQVPNQLPQLGQVSDADKPLILNIPLVCQIEIPVGVAVKSAD
jgi:hypothetical protein